MMGSGSDQDGMIRPRIPRRRVTCSSRRFPPVRQRSAAWLAARVVLARPRRPCSGLQPSLPGRGWQRSTKPQSPTPRDRQHCPGKVIVVAVRSRECLLLPLESPGSRQCPGCPCIMEPQWTEKVSAHQPRRGIESADEVVIFPCFPPFYVEFGHNSTAFVS